MLGIVSSPVRGSHSAALRYKGSRRLAPGHVCDTRSAVAPVRASMDARWRLVRREAVADQRSLLIEDG